MAGDLVNLLVEEAKQKGVKVDDFKITGNDGTNSQAQVSISAENLAKLREIAPYYQQLAAEGRAASQALKDNPIKNLKEITVVKNDKIFHFFPFE